MQNLGVAVSFAVCLLKIALVNSLLDSCNEPTANDERNEP